MDGVTILYSYVENTPRAEAIIVPLIGALILFASAIWCIYLAIKEKDLAPIVVILLCVLFISIFIALSVSEINKVPYEVYEVTIDQSVSMIDFNNMYNIIGQKGDIFIVTLK